MHESCFNARCHTWRLQQKKKPLSWCCPPGHLLVWWPTDPDLKNKTDYTLICSLSTFVSPLSKVLEILTWLNTSVLERFSFWGGFIVSSTGLGGRGGGCLLGKQSLGSLYGLCGTGRSSSALCRLALPGPPSPRSQTSSPDRGWGKVVGSGLSYRLDSSVWRRSSMLS